MAKKATSRAIGSMGIVGWGPFSELIVRHLAPYASETLVASRRFSSGRIKGGLARFAPTEEVLTADLIILAIPSQHLDEYLSKNAKLIKPEALVVDVCSVKEGPVNVLRKHVSKNVQVIATHPLFGPGSARNGIEGLKIMVYPVDSSPVLFKQMKTFLSTRLKLDVIEATPEEHDKMMAYVLGLTQSIGRAAQDLDLPATALSTVAYDDLMDMKKIQGGDSWSIYESIMLDNPHSMEVLEEFIKRLQKLKNELQK